MPDQLLPGIAGERAVGVADHHKQARVAVSHRDRVRPVAQQSSSNCIAAQALDPERGARRPDSPPAHGADHRTHQSTTTLVMPYPTRIFADGTRSSLRRTRKGATGPYREPTQPPSTTTHRRRQARHRGAGAQSSRQRRAPAARAGSFVEAPRPAHRNVASSRFRRILPPPRAATQRPIAVGPTRTSNDATRVAHASPEFGTCDASRAFGDQQGEAGSPARAMLFVRHASDRSACSNSAPGKQSNRDHDRLGRPAPRARRAIRHEGDRPLADQPEHRSGDISMARPAGSGHI